MKQLINRIRGSQLITVMSYTAVSTAIKLLTSFITAKFIAIYLGPSGLGLLGQLASFVAIMSTLSVGGINMGVVKFIAEYNDDKQKQYRFIKASIIITISCSLFIGLIVSLFSNQWSMTLFHTTEYASILVVFGCTLMFYGVYILFTSILNGLKEFKKFNYIGIWSSLISFTFTISMIFFFDLYGALLSMVTFQSVVFIVLVFFISGLKQIQLKEIVQTLATKKEYLALSKFALMTIITISCLPAAQIFIRNYLGANVDASAVGYYEGMNRISILSMTLITNTLTIYYLPKLSELSDDYSIRKEILKVAKIILPITFLLILAIFLLRVHVIKIIFAPSFEPMQVYFLPQLAGDLFRITGYMIAFHIWAKAMTKTVIFSEIFFSITITLLSVWFINLFGGVGSVYAYALNQFIYLVTMVFLFRNLIFNSKLRSTTQK